MPVYAQPALPGPGYLWVPGYWAWDEVTGYYWVPGTWVMPPSHGLLWTPGYWGWDNGVYLFHAGYWGPHVGFYGGVSYGYGYTGSGYAGGYWNNGAFFYNRSVNNFGGVTVNNVYNKTVVVNNVTNVSYNGGTGGVAAKPTPAETAAANEPHTPPTQQQVEHGQAAAKNPALALKNNQGHPAVAATPHAGQFSGPGVVAAHPGKPVASAQPESHNPNGSGQPGGANRPATEPQEGAQERTQERSQEHNQGGPQEHVPGSPQEHLQEHQEHLGTTGGPGPNTQAPAAAKPATPHQAPAAGPRGPQNGGNSPQRAAAAPPQRHSSGGKCQGQHC